MNVPDTIDGATYRWLRESLDANCFNALVACEESASTRIRLAAIGWNAWSCDLMASRVPGKHYQGDVFDIFDLPWDLVISHPPCTFLSSSGMHWNKNPSSYRYGGHQTEEALRFVERLLAGRSRFKGLENPRGIIGTRIRPYNQSVQPWQFGDDASKTTDFWTENLPLLTIDESKFFPPRVVEWPRGSGKMVKRWGNQTDSGQNRLGPSDDRAMVRSKTYDGIADAMARDWGKYALDILTKEMFG